MCKQTCFCDPHCEQQVCGYIWNKNINNLAADANSVWEGARFLHVLWAGLKFMSGVVAEIRWVVEKKKLFSQEVRSGGIMQYLNLKYCVFSAHIDGIRIESGGSCRRRDVYFSRFLSSAALIIMISKTLLIICWDFVGLQNWCIALTCLHVFDTSTCLWHFSLSFYFLQCFVLLAGKAPRLYNTENGFIFSFTFQCPSEPACTIKGPGILISHSYYCYYYN